MNGPYGTPLTLRNAQLNTPTVTPLWQRLMEMYNRNQGILGQQEQAGMLGAGLTRSGAQQTGSGDRDNMDARGTPREDQIGDYGAGTIAGRIGSAAGALMGVPGIGGVVGALGTAQDISRANRDLAALGIGPVVDPIRAYAGAFSPMPTGIVESMFGPVTPQSQFNAAVVSRMMPDEYVSQLDRVVTESQFGMTPQELGGILGAYSNDYYGGVGSFGGDFGAGVDASTGYDGGGYAGSMGGFDV